VTSPQTAPQTVTYRSSIEQLRSAQKSGAGEPAYLRWVNRPLGARAAAVAHQLGVTPNTVTAVSGVLSLGGLVAIAVVGTSVPGAITASALLLAGFVLDSADGQLARLAGAGNVAGEWLDHVVDAVRLPAAHLAIAAALFAASIPPAGIGVALLFSLVASVWFFAATLGGKLQATAAGTRSASPTWVSFAKLPYDTSALFFVVLLLPWPDVFLPVYAVLFLLTLAAACAALVRKFRTLKRFP